jgi:predicted nucleotidyltransferase
VNNPQARLGGIARSRSLSPGQRSRIARHAARSRWQRRQAGILTIAEIRSMVRDALMAHLGSIKNVSAFLFGSYARGEARPDSDLDIMVVEKNIITDEFHEVWAIRMLLTDQKSIDLLVLDKRTFDRGKVVSGTVQNDVVREGVRLV